MRERHSSGTAAWPVHLVLLAAALVLAAAVIRRRSLAGTVRLLLAPFGKSAAARLVSTLRAGARPSVMLRIVVGFLPAAILVYSPLRAAAQVVGGLDPNFTVNAWGGPSYVGAMACHYLDGVWMMAASAWLLDRVLLNGEHSVDCQAVGHGSG